MNRVVHENRRSEWLQDCNAMLVSAVCNLVAMLALGLLTIATSGNWGGVKLYVNSGIGDSPLVDDSPLEDVAAIRVEADPAAAVGPITPLEQAVIPSADFAALEVSTASSAQASGAEGTAFGGKGEGEGITAASSAEFFGIGGYGQTFVYVVDASDSMNENGKFERAKYELLQSIEQLASDQRYFVIFYNDRAYPMDADDPVLATEKQFAETAQWVNHAVASNGTNPLPALLHAISLKPDAIFFLSDGQFDPMTHEVLKIRNRPSRRVQRRQIPIHTIAFVDHMTIGLMRSIARTSGGEFRFVK